MACGRSFIVKVTFYTIVCDKSDNRETRAYHVSLSKVVLLLSFIFAEVEHAKCKSSFIENTSGGNS
ncbi:hypothetical protein Bca101_016675 [Brassica carinata]